MSAQWSPPSGNGFREAQIGAVILIDEADVFLERRQVKDLQRNSLVSGELVSYYSKIRRSRF